MIIRHDIDPTEYLAEPQEANGIGSFKPYGDHAMLIHPNWLITAAHVAAYLDKEETFTFFNGVKTDFTEIILHEGFKETPDFENDIALIRLKSDISEIAPISINVDENERGEILRFYGCGETGDGILGNIKEDMLLRRADNKVVDVTEQWIIFKFESPQETGVLDLEGISGPGDSGGPALMLDVLRGQVKLAGISSWHDNKELKLGTYGTYEYYTRLSKYINWIEKNISNSQPKTFSQ